MATTSLSEKTLILHGWSDCSKSFIKLKEYLVNRKSGKVETIFYGDYESREDNITFNDVIDGLNDQFIEKGFIDSNGKKLCRLNVIVHSTGGLVIRHWIWRYYYRDKDRIKDCPVTKLIMLAPANFGSPLAHQGRSFLGRLFKGRWKIGDMLEVGQNLLDGLELASPYQWELAHHDLLYPTPYYSASKIQMTILVGIKDYDGLRGWVNKPGTDGTVVIAGTSLDSAKLVLDYTRSAGSDSRFQWQYQNPPDDFAFGVLEGIDHGSIVDPTSPDKKEFVGKFILEALKTKNVKDFRNLVRALESVTEGSYKNNPDKPEYQQFLLHVVDDHGNSVPDFTVEFFVFQASKSVKGIIKKDIFSKEENEMSREVNEMIRDEFHRHSKDASYRRFLVNAKGISNFLENKKKKLNKNLVVSMRVYVPQIDKDIGFQEELLQNIVIYDQSGKLNSPKKLFYPNTTTLVELRVNRLNNYVSVSTKPADR